MCRCCSIGCFTHEKNYKKLEKVGNPFACNYFGGKRMLIMQKFKLHLIPAILPHTPHIYIDRGNEGTVVIEVKQKQ